MCGREQEELRVLAETVPQLVWATRPDGYLIYWNQRFAHYLHTYPEGYVWRQFLHPDDYQRVIETRERSLETGEPYEIEYRLRNGQTGYYRWFLTRGTPVRDAAGRIITWFGTCTDIEEQKRTEEALRQSQERSQALMESTIMGVVIAEGDTLIEANSAFLQMTGYSQEEIQSGMLSISTIAPPEYAPLDRRATEELTISQQIKPYETAYVCKDGSRLPILVGVVTLPFHPSRTVGFVLDNSARKELERRKDDFISMASHELKTPLTSLKLQMQLLAKHLTKQGTPLSALTRMEEQVKRLERLVNELLDVSKIQAGRLEYALEELDVDELIQNIAETMQQMSATHTINVRGAAGIPLVGDRDRLGQVFTNLISNAIKYSPTADQVEIEISREIETIIISVRDHGIGIPQEQRSKIFERFHRAVEPGQKAFPGMGMGLYIVAEIIKHHGGTITVESKLGKGSAFHVILPAYPRPVPGAHSDDLRANPT